MVKDLPEKKPCPCPICKGALMSKRTIRRHRGRCIPPSVNITSCEDWIKLEAEESAGDTLGGGTDEKISSDEEDIYGRPSKRCRTGREIRPEVVC